MKRILPLLLALLLLTACGTVPAADPTPEPLPEETLPAHVESPDEDELPIFPVGDGDAAPPAEEDAPASPALSDTEVTLDGISSFLRLTLPEGWTWEKIDNPKGADVIVLHPESDPDFSVELRLWKDGFPGMCGTGVTFTDYTLADGRKANIAYETIGNSISWTMILPESPDSFTVQFNADTAVYEAHRAEFELMLATLRQGVLAGLDVVSPSDATG